LHFAKSPDHDVEGLQITVNDALTVRKANRQTDLLEDADEAIEVVGVRLTLA
jgi:hypothetical protein